jgi:hypothetical protein
MADPARFRWTRPVQFALWTTSVTQFALIDDIRKFEQSKTLLHHNLNHNRLRNVQDANKYVADMLAFVDLLEKTSQCLLDHANYTIDAVKCLSESLVDAQSNEQ